jgi:hypothetical protein
MDGHSKWERMAPITGIVFVVLVILTFVVGGSTPGDKDSAQKVLSFYSKHRTKEQAADLLFAGAALFMMFYAATLARRVRLHEQRPGGLSWLTLAAGAVASSGFLVFAGMQWALAESSKLHDGQVIRTINMFANNTFLPFLGGFCLFVVSAGLAVALSRALPAWFGWVGFVLGVLIFNPIGWVAAAVALLWTLASAIWMLARPPVQGGASAAPSAATSGPPL